MRTTITIEDAFLTELKRHASTRGFTLSRLIEDTLRWAFAERPLEEPSESFELPTFGRGGNFPSINLDKTSALIEADDLHRFGHES